MKDYKSVDYDALFDDLMKHYLSPEYYLATKSSIKCIVDIVTATTIDEYFKLLMEGYINVEVREDLGKYINELIEDKWFHQWPLILFEYVSRSLHQKNEVNFTKKKSKKIDTSIDKELEILDSLAKEGWPGAMTEIGSCFLCGFLPNRNYESSICLWVYASRKGYRNAGACLYSQFIQNKHEQLCEELQMFVLEETAKWLLEKNDATLEDYTDKLDKWDLEKYKKACKTVEKLKKIVFERTFMRETVGNFFWPEGESPYDIKF